MASRVRCKNSQAIQQHLEIVVQPARFLVADRHAGFFDRAVPDQVAEQVVAARQAHRQLENRGTAGEAAQGQAVPIHHTHLTVDIQQEHHRLTGGVIRNAAAETEPSAVEQITPLVACAQAQLLTGATTVEGHRLSRAPGSHLQVPDNAVDVFLDSHKRAFEVFCSVRCEVRHRSIPIKTMPTTVFPFPAA